MVESHAIKIGGDKYQSVITLEYSFVWFEYGLREVHQAATMSSSNHFEFPLQS